jgi:hypothetical protein
MHRGYDKGTQNFKRKYQLQYRLWEYSEGINWNRLAEDVVQWWVYEEQDDEPWDAIETDERINY